MPQEPPEHQLIPATIVEAGYLRLPYDHDQFKEFIKGLLGRPQTISRTIEGPFEIRIEDVKSLSDLITQRVSQQNGGILASFSARVAYSDNSTVEVTSIPELLSYNETRPVSCSALHLRWDFLVRFQDKQVPEKQSVQVSYVTSFPGGLFSLDDDPTYFMERPYLGMRPGYIGFRVEHTARSWGADIEALLSGYFKSLVRPETGIRNWLRTHRHKVSFGLAALFFGLVTLGLVLTTRRFSEIQLSRLRTTLSADPGAASRFIADILARGVWAQFAFTAVLLLVISAFLSIWFGVWSEDALDMAPPSFILLNRESEKHRDFVLARRKRRWLSLCAAVVSSLVTSVVANLIFAWLFT